MPGPRLPLELGFNFNKMMRNQQETEQLQGKDQDISLPTCSALNNIYRSNNILDLLIIICVSLPWYQLLLGVGSWILGSISNGVVLCLPQETHSLGLISTPHFVPFAPK